MNKQILTSEEIKEIDIGYLTWDFIRTLSIDSLRALQSKGRDELKGVKASLVDAKDKGKRIKNIIIKKEYIERNLSTINGHISKIVEEEKTTKNKDLKNQITKLLEINESLRKENKRLLSLLDKESKC